jgi:hypothetical protein
MGCSSSFFIRLMFDTCICTEVLHLELLLLFISTNRSFPSILVKFGFPSTPPNLGVFQYSQ